MKDRKIGFFSVAFMYVGTIMGAGFASGREIWQFFGVFGQRGLAGVAFVAILFVIVGIMISMITIKINDNDMGKVIVPAGNDKLVRLVGYFMAFILYIVLITMSAAGGALFNQQFGMEKSIGGIIIVVLVIATVIGGFERISHVFRYIMPVLLIVVIGTCIAVIMVSSPKDVTGVTIKPSPLASNWIFNPILYLSYNMLAIIPIVSTAAISAKNARSAIGGAALGGICLGFLALVLAMAMLTDPLFSQSMDMPMLAYSTRLGKVANLVYTFVLMFAIYSSATGNFYGFTTILKDNKRKNLIIVIVALVAFVFGLVGFKNIVAYVFPISGFLGLAIIVLITINFVQLVIMNKGDKNERNQ
ncbi:MAG: hypothetical protein RR495_00865 [Anaerovoracaceae bacterium]